MSNDIPTLKQSTIKQHTVNKNMSNDSKIIKLGAPDETNAPPIILSAADQKEKSKRENDRLKQKEKDNKEYESAAKNYTNILNEYIDRYIGALEHGEDQFAQMNTAWKMRCGLINGRGSKIIANPLDFEKALDRVRSMADNIPPLADVINMHERKLIAISVLLNEFHDKEHVLWRNINEIVFPKPKEVPVPTPSEEPTTDNQQSS